MVLLFVEHKGRNSPSSVGTVTGLTANMDGSMAPTILVLGAGNGTSGHWHGEVSNGRRQMEITEVVDGGNNQPMVFLISLPS